MKKYGLQLRIPLQQQQKKPAATKPTLPPTALGFGLEDEDDVESEIARQAAKNRALRELICFFSCVSIPSTAIHFIFYISFLPPLQVEEKHKKALEEDPSVFYYDGVYDEMKEKIARPVLQDRTERKSKYIEKLMEKAKQRQIEQETIYEKKLVKERSKEDHLYQDKEKFVTSAYRKKLEEQEKWMAEERLRQLLEERDDVTKKSVTDFYFNLDKNVAFGAQRSQTIKSANQEKMIDISSENGDDVHTGKEIPCVESADNGEENRSVYDFQSETSRRHENGSRSSDATPSTVVSAVVVEENAATWQESEEKRIAKFFKRSEDAVAAARERYLVRKIAQEHL